MIFRPVRRDFSIFLLVFPIIVAGVKSDFNPDTYLPTNKIIQRHGYPSETHEVTTDDGYILTIHRIPRGKGQFRDQRTLRSTPQPNDGPCPVYFQHGVLSSSSDWIIHGPNNSLAYRLADKGHDIWLGNIRGNTYSRSHVTLSPNDYVFWNFSFNEMAVHDVPTMIDYILKTTGHTQLYYIGHSMGTTMFWVLCSSRPEYNSKIKAMFSLAPVAFMSNAQTPIRYVAPFAKDIGLITKWFGHGEFMPRNSFMNYVLKFSCELTAIEAKMCENSLFIICGYDSKEFEMEMLPVILAHTPAGGSSKTLQHYAQLIQSAKFRQFDYGDIGNMKQYNSSIPPAYNLSLITAPVSLHYSDNDYLANVKDVKQLAQSLPNLIGAYRVKFHLFNHIDFLWSRDINSLLNDLIMQQIESIEKGVLVPYNKKSLDEIPVIEEKFYPDFNDISPLLNLDEEDEKGDETLNSIMDFKKITFNDLIRQKLKKQAQFDKNSKRAKDLSINDIEYRDETFKRCTK